MAWCKKCDDTGYFVRTDPENWTLAQEVACACGIAQKIADARAQSQRELDELERRYRGNR